MGSKSEKSNNIKYSCFSYDLTFITEVFPLPCPLLLFVVLSLLALLLHIFCINYLLLFLMALYKVITLPTIAIAIVVALSGIAKNNGQLFAIPV